MSNLTNIAIDWTIDGAILKGSDGTSFAISPHEYWILAPARVTWEQHETWVKATDFAMLLHNAIVGRGLVVSMEVLLDGIHPATHKRGASADAELLLEQVRAEEFPGKPSRLRSHFLNFSRATAERRRSDMFRGSRYLARCRLIGAGTYHSADVRIYESLEGRPDDKELARRYWQPYVPEGNDDQHLEILVSCALFFPDWRDFPLVPDPVLLAWQVGQTSGNI